MVPLNLLFSFFDQHENCIFVFLFFFLSFYSRWLLIHVFRLADTNSFLMWHDCVALSTQIKCHTFRWILLIAIGLTHSVENNFIRMIDIYTFTVYLCALHILFLLFLLAIFSKCVCVLAQHLFQRYGMHDKKPNFKQLTAYLITMPRQSHIICPIWASNFDQLLEFDCAGDCVCEPFCILWHRSYFVKPFIYAEKKVEKMKLFSFVFLRSINVFYKSDC